MTRREWPALCEEPECTQAATHLFGIAGSKPTAHACCKEHMSMRIAELNDWQQRHGAIGEPVLLTRESGGESFWLAMWA